MTRRRLDAWKEIARYLGRDVTTVRRWEKREGLPVHRHRHEKLGSVYAWADEIDAWSERRAVRAEPAPLPEPAPPPAPRLRPWKVGLGLAGIAAIVAVLSSSLAPGTRAGADRPGHIALTTPAGVIVESLVISPDGKQVAFAGKDSAGVRLWIRRLDSAAVEPIAGTEGATHPFWSPESDQVGFFAAGWLKRVGLATRTVHQIAVAPDGRGGTWNDRDDILFVADSGAPVSRVSVFGGDVTAATSLAAGVKVGHAWPEFLPDGRHFLYTDYSADPQQYGIHVGDVDTRNSRRLLPVYSSAAYSRDGYLLFVRNSLMAQPFDVERLELQGSARPVAEFVRQRFDLGFKGDFSVSHTGVVAVRSGGADENRLVWIDRRTGTETASVGDLAWYSNPTLSRDGTQLAVTAGNGTTSDLLWVFDAVTLAGRPMTQGRGVSYAPVWSPNAKRLIFAGVSAETGGGLYEKLVADGASPTPVLQASMPQVPESWSRDGVYMTFMTLNRSTRADIWAWRMTEPREAFPILNGPDQEGQSQISPDGRFLAYASDESGRFEVYVTTFPAADRRWQVSTGGGTDPRWRGNGGELFYIASDRWMTVVPTTLQPAFSTGRSAALFETQLDDVWIGDTRNHYDVSPDGERFVVIAPKSDRRLAPFTVLTNWQRVFTRQ